MLRQFFPWALIAFSGIIPNVYALVDVGYNSYPSFVDIDEDGDLDLFIANNDGIVRFYQNTGNTSQAILLEQEENNNPLYGIDLGTDVHIDFADLNADGLQDLISGDLSGKLVFLINTGTAQAPKFDLQNRVDLIDAPAYASPALMDLDADGDLDLFVGTETGKINLFLNIGNAQTPSFLLQADTDNPLAGVNVLQRASPSFVDVDQDGDLDLFVGNEGGQLTFFQNNGSTTVAMFDTTENIGAAGNINGAVGTDVVPTLVDIDNDGDLDLFSTTSNGVVQFFRNDGSIKQANFRLQSNEQNLLNGITIGTQAAPSFFDVDNDNDMDLFIVDNAGTIRLIENIGNNLSPIFKDTGITNPFLGVNFGTQARLHFIDIDADQDLDAFVSNSSNIISYQNNNGRLQQVNTGFDEIDFKDELVAGFADTDQDGDIDVLMFDSAGQLRFYENSGSINNAIFNQDTIIFASNFFLNIDNLHNGRLSLVDIDNDGDQDLFITNSSGNIRAFLNDGTANFTETSPLFPTMTVFNDFQLSFTDWDQDEDMDAFIGATDGKIRFYQNTDNIFVEQTGTANPLNSINVGNRSSPIWFDINNDGKDELLIGNSYGSLLFYQLNNLAILQQHLQNLSNPFVSIPILRDSQPHLADMDQDGDLDLLVASTDGAQYYENLGTADYPQFGINLDTGEAASPFLIDIDADQDLDMIIGSADGDLDLVFNMGDQNQAHFVPASTNNSNFFNTITKISNSIPAVGDLNADGLQDIIVGNKNGNIKLYMNQGTASSPKWVEINDNSNPFININIGRYNSPYLVDLDQDTDLDLVIGESTGHLYFFKNIGDKNTPSFIQLTGIDNPFQNIQGSVYISPSFEDIDGDQDLDLFFGDQSKQISYAENTGNANNPLFQSTSNSSFLTNINASLIVNSTNFGIVPSFADIDGDGLNDLIVGLTDGTIHYFKRNNTANGTEFTSYQLPNPPSNGTPENIPSNSNNTFAIGDLNQDGRTDLLVHSNSIVIDNNSSIPATIQIFLNRNTQTYSDLNLTNIANTRIIDLNQDDRFDIISGSSTGELSILQQEDTGQFSQISLISNNINNNPFSQTRLPRATPQFIDIDQDNDFDALIGQADGRLAYYVNIGSPDQALYTAISTDSIITELDKPTLEQVNLSETSLESLNASNLQNIPADSFQALNKDNIATMPAEAFSNLSADQLKQMDENALQGLQTEQYQQIPTNSFSGLNSRNIGGFTAAIIQQWDKELITALNAEQIRQAEGRDLSKIITNINPQEIQPDDIRNLLPSDWTIDSASGQLTVPAGTSIQLQAQQPQITDEHVRLPVDIPNLDTHFGLGGLGNGDTILDSMNKVLQNSDIGQQFTQTDSGIIKIDENFAFLPDHNAMRQAETDATSGLKAQVNGRFSIITIDQQEISLIPAPKDPIAVRDVLERYGNVELDIGSAGDVLLSLRINDNRRATSQSRYVISFDSSIEPAPDGLEEGISIDSSGNLILIYTDGTSQQIYSTIIDPNQFIELTLSISGVENNYYNSDGTFIVTYQSNDYRLTPQLEINSTTLAENTDISPFVSVTPEGLIQYTLQEGQEQIDMFLSISPL